MDELSLRRPGVDYFEIPSIHQKRTLAFINHFITSTVTTMNKLARSCEVKLQKFDYQLQQMDACLRIIEAKLDSVPGLDGLAPPPPPSQLATVEPALSPSHTETVQQEQEPPTTTATTPVASQDPMYARFFRMVQVGVPPQAVKLKMQQEGLDPSVLDNPGAAPPPPHAAETTREDSDSDSGSSGGN